MKWLLRAGGLGLILGMGLGAAHAQYGTVNYAGQVNDSSGYPVGDGGVVLVLANTSGTDNGFAVLTPGSLTPNSVFNGSYLVVAATQVTSGDGLGGFDGSQRLSYTGSLAPGDQLAIVWVPGVTNPSGSLNAGMSYGLYTQSNDTSWLTPTSGNTADLSVTGANASFTAMSAVPEPGTWGVIAGAAALLYAWSRRRAAASASG